MFRDSLPQTTAQNYPSGTTFIVRGVNFEFLPNEVVIGWSIANVTQNADAGILFIVSKTSNVATFEFRSDFSPSNPHTYEYFAYGFEIPRTVFPIEIV